MGCFDVHTTNVMLILPSHCILWPFLYKPGTYTSPQMAYIGLKNDGQIVVKLRIVRQNCMQYKAAIVGICCAR